MKRYKLIIHADAERQMDEAARQVHITAVIYGKRDQAAQTETIIEN